MSNYKAGDRVEFIEDYGTTATKGTRGTVSRAERVCVHEDDEGRKVTQLVHIESDDGKFVGGAFDTRIKPEAVAQPVHFRICVGTQIGTKEYLTLEAAKEAAVEHGNANEEFSIFEVVLIASYVVKAAKYLEEK